jgi:hypothetical protein
LDLSKLKLDVYDFLAIILPGLIVTAEGWILLRGWNAFISSMSSISGTGLTLLLVFAFGAGHIVQELGDISIKLVMGKRFSYSGRDRFWTEKEAAAVKKTIKEQCGHEIESVDGAFDYCLTKVKGLFDKRDVFMATSDLCRSIFILSFLALAPAARIAFWSASSCRHAAYVFLRILALLVVVAILSWLRMKRFRYLSEVTVFRAYLAVPKDPRSE